jgi:alginate O-acetyltransferase complex protein AlgI
MVFSSMQFLIFACLIILAMKIIKDNKIKKWIILVGSYYFYGCWDYRFLLLIFGMTLINYVIGKEIEKNDSNTVKRFYLSLGIVIDLLILGFFKYFNFFLNSVNELLSKYSIRIDTLKIILPVGISFITFEVMSYIVDIYRKDSKPAKTLWDFAILVAFFPHMISGPILKPHHFLPQLDNDIIIKKKNIESGIQIFMFGLVKKVLIADRLAGFVDIVYNNPSLYSSITIWLTMIAYSIQIYCDFSGYTDMAIGSAKCLGFEIPRNFNMPYISRSITEFWKRWHISLSEWLRDYLYIPLGGNRKGRVRQYINLLTVMTLGGLWHGSSWNFVVWGGFHGLALILHKLYMKYVKLGKGNSIIYSFFSWLNTYIFICVTWIFFRSKDFETSLLVVKKAFFMGNTIGIDWYYTYLLIIIVVLVIGHYIGTKVKGYIIISLNTFYGLYTAFIVILAIFLLNPVNSSPFIYFQF